MIPDMYSIVARRFDGQFYEVDKEGLGVYFREKIEAVAFAQQLAQKQEVEEIYVVKRHVVAAFKGSKKVHPEDIPDAGDHDREGDQGSGQAGAP